MPVTRIGTQPTFAAPRSTAAPTGSTLVTRTGFTATSAFEAAPLKVPSASQSAWVDMPGDDEAPVPSWAQEPRGPDGEGMFEGKSAQQIANMGFDQLKSASPRELYSLRSRQLPGAESVVVERFGELKKGQRRAFLRAKILAGIFESVVSTLQKHSRIAG